MRPYCRAIRHFLDCHGNYKHNKSLFWSDNTGEYSVLRLCIGPPAAVGPILPPSN